MAMGGLHSSRTGGDRMISCLPRGPPRRRWVTPLTDESPRLQPRASSTVVNRRPVARVVGPSEALTLARGGFREKAKRHEHSPVPFGQTVRSADLPRRHPVQNRQQHRAGEQAPRHGQPAAVRGVPAPERVVVASWGPGGSFARLPTGARCSFFRRPTSPDDARAQQEAEAGFKHQWRPLPNLALPHADYSPSKAS
jgi:hypothetical protein